MSGTNAELLAVLDSAGEDDADRLSELTRRLRRELLDLDVDAVGYPDADAPEGAKGGPIAFGAIVVRFVLRRDMLKSIVDTTVSWLGRQRLRSVKLTLDGDTLEVVGLTSEEQSRLIEVWVSRHTGDG